MKNEIYILFGMVLFGLVLSQARTVSAAGPTLPTLGAAGTFTILAASGISTTGVTSVVGDIGVSPVTSTAITGFGLVLDSSGTFSKSSLVTGKVYAADYSPPTPANMIAAISAMQTAYTTTVGVTAPPANVALGAGTLSGLTLTPGLYKWSTNVDASGATLNCQGNSSSTFIFQVAGTLTMDSGSAVNLIGGCQPQNIYWQVAGQVTLGTTSSFQGVILTQTAIVVNTGAQVNGRLLAQTAVTLNADAVTAPTGSGSTTTTIPTTTISSLTTTPTTTIGGGGPRTSPLTIADNINTTVIPGNSTTPVVTAYLRDASGSGIVTKRQFYQSQLPTTLTLNQNQIANLSFTCSFIISGINYNFANNIYGVGTNAQCNKNYTVYGGAFAGIYTASTTARVPIATKVILPVIIPVVLPTNAVIAKTLPFPWLGSGYYEIALGGPNIPATGMIPGVAYWVTNQAFISTVNEWLAS